ncbi:MAG: Gfo/Idh/MocA family oxidoreductase, partial [Mariniphaga sp.]|nr:Gfo/Idh/MocA family oxidoreductase [Mariniphaga sp.]
MNRRNFIGKAAAGAAAVTIIPRHVMGGKGFVAANNRINLGFIGTGKQVPTLLNGIGKCKGTVVVAASDVFERKLNPFLEAANKNNSTKGMNVKTEGYHYYRELLERSDIDAVVIATHDHWHAQIVVDAAKAGKDIY